VKDTEGTLTGSAKVSTSSSSTDISSNTIDKADELDSPVIVSSGIHPRQHDESKTTRYSTKARNPTTRVGPKIEVNEPLTISVSKSDDYSEKQDFPRIQYHHRSKRGSRLHRRGAFFSTCTRSKPRSQDGDATTNHNAQMEEFPIERARASLEQITTPKKGVSSETTLILGDQPIVEKAFGEEVGPNDTLDDLSKI